MLLAGINMPYRVPRPQSFVAAVDGVGFVSAGGRLNMELTLTTLSRMRRVLTWCCCCRLDRRHDWYPKHLDDDLLMLLGV